MLQIGGVQKTSLLDFPDKISAIVFTQGCNFRCGYCHNPELIVLKNEPAWTVPAFFDFLKLRQGKLDGVVITGGEPCMQPDLSEFIQEIKQMGFLVKLDSNGTLPDKLRGLMPNLDYIAMDIKAPLKKYPLVTHTEILPEKIRESISLIMNSGVDYEFRTTVVKSQLAFEDFTEIGKLINGAKRYYLQKFVPSKTLDPELMDEKTYTEDEFKQVIKIMAPYVEYAALR